MEFDDLMAKAGFTRPTEQQPPAPAGAQPGAPPAEGAPAAPPAEGSPPPQGSQQVPAAGDAPPDPLKEYENKLLNERFGGKFKSLDEIAERVTSYEKLHKDHTDLSERSKKLIEPADDLVKKLNEARSKGVSLEAFMIAQRIDQEQNPINVIALANQIKFGLSPEDALWKAQRQYAAATVDKDDHSFDADLSREAKIQLSIDAAESKKFLEQYKTDALMPVTVTPQMQQQKLQERQEAWKPELPKVMADFKKLNFTQTVEGYGEIPVDFEVPRETIDAVQKYVMEDVLSLDGVEPIVGKDNDEIKDIVRSKIIELSFDAMIKKAITDTATAIRMKELAQKHNPSGARQEQAPAGATGTAGAPDKDRVYANQFLPSFPVNK